jgi:hypothetical protein
MTSLRRFWALLSPSNSGMSSAKAHRQGSTLPSSSVPLHQLCTNCSRFCKEWDVLNWIQQAGPATTRTSRLCTVAHLVANRGVCHFCNFLLASLQRSQNIKTELNAGLSLYLQPQDNDATDQRVHASVADEIPTESTPFVAFILRIYRGMSSLTMISYVR